MARPLFRTALAFTLLLGATSCGKDDAAPDDTVDASTGGSPGNTGGTTTASGGRSSSGGSVSSGGPASGGIMASGGSRDDTDGGGAAPGTGGATSAVPPKGKSAGCGKTRPSADGATNFVKHDITVTGVDPAFIDAHPANGGSWTDRTYFVRLPDGYDPSKPYPVTFGGGGCGATDGASGKNGGLSTLPQGQKDAIQIGLNYVYPKNAGACFADDFVNTPDLPYFDAVLAEVEANYCVNRDEIFAAGFSSGAWETFLFSCARAGVVRGIGTAAGGLRKTRPACTDQRVAAMMVVGLQDTENPIGPLEPPGKNDSLGSAPMRDDLLARNGCDGTETEPWDPQYPACVKYKGCPAAYPVVWCPIDATHGDGGDYSSKGFWKFWSSLPSP
jgi:polyhydroxybutyrate depolymerase